MMLDKCTSDQEQASKVVTSVTREPTCCLALVAFGSRTRREHDDEVPKISHDTQRPLQTKTENYLLMLLTSHSPPVISYCRLALMMRFTVTRLSAVEAPG